jgi:hypothetical protein
MLLMSLSIGERTPVASNLWGLCPRAHRLQGRSFRSPSAPWPTRAASRCPWAASERAAFPRGPVCPTKPRKVHGFQTKTKEHHMSKTDNRPSHRVYAVTKNGERSFWQPIGAAWVHSDGWGFNVKLGESSWILSLHGAQPGQLLALPEIKRRMDAVKAKRTLAISLLASSLNGTIGRSLYTQRLVRRGDGTRSDISAWLVPTKNCRGYRISARRHLGAHSCHVRPVSSRCCKP